MNSKGLSTDRDLKRWADQLFIPLNAVVFKDELRNLVPKPGGYIINLESSHNRTGGTHWVALWLSPKHATYFDSFGIVAPVDVLRFIRQWNATEFTMSTKEIQNINSGYCGEWDLLFLSYMARGLSFQDFIDQFKDNLLD